MVQEYTLNCKVPLSGILLSCIALIIAITTQSLSAGQNIPRVAVLDLKTIGDDASVGKGASEILRTILMETGDYIVVERSEIVQVLEEKRFNMSGAVSAEAVVNLGTLLDANIVAIGSVVKMGKSYALNVRFVDVQTGQVFTEKKITVQTIEELPELCSDIVDVLAGHVVKQKKRQIMQPRIPSNSYKTQSYRKESISDAGNWAIGVLYPGTSLKYITSGKNAIELRAQLGSGIVALGPRYYRYLAEVSSTRLFCGLEGDYITFKGKESKGTGLAGGAFVGGEIFLTKQVGLLMDFGPMYISVSDSQYTQAVRGLDYILNMGIYWHFN